jgi:hypothetical protein
VPFNASLKGHRTQFNPFPLLLPLVLAFLFLLLPPIRVLFYEKKRQRLLFTLTLLILVPITLPPPRTVWRNKEKNIYARGNATDLNNYLALPITTILVFVDDTVPIRVRLPNAQGISPYNRHSHITGSAPSLESQSEP